MIRKVLISTAALCALAIAAPASAGNYGGSTSGWKPKPPKTSTSGGNTTTTSGGTKVPEPGMLGMAAAGLIGLGAIQLRRRKAAKR